MMSADFFLLQEIEPVLFFSFLRSLHAYKIFNRYMNGEHNCRLPTASITCECVSVCVCVQCTCKIYCMTYSAGMN